MMRIQNQKSHSSENSLRRSCRHVVLLIFGALLMTAGCSGDSNKALFGSNQFHFLDGAVSESYSSGLPLPPFDGAVEPYVFSFVGSTEPPGLDINESNGVVTGIPTESGNFDFTIRVVDGNGVERDIEANLVIAAVN